MALYTYNQRGITIPIGSVGTPGYGGPFPSEIKTKRIREEITQVSVTIKKLTSQIPGDLSLFFNKVQDPPVNGKSNKSLVLMSGAGSNFAIANVTFKFSDQGEPLPVNSLLASGSNTVVEAQPTYNPGQDPLTTFPLSLSTTTLGETFKVFNNSDPNGIWQLYTTNQPSTISQGSETATIKSWTLNIITNYKSRVVVDDSRNREGQSNNRIFFKISLDAASEKPVTINYKTRPGTATKRDYQSVNSLVIFNPGETEKLVAVNIVDDNIRENNETFELILSTKNKLVRLRDRVAVGTIVDNDGATSQAQSDELLGKINTLTGNTDSQGLDPLPPTPTPSRSLQTTSLVSNISREETLNTKSYDLSGNTYSREDWLKQIVPPHDLLTVREAVSYT